MRRLAAIDGLRACCALYVMIFHILCYTVSDKAPFPLLLRPLMQGHEAVCVFIVISGFCLGLPIAKNGMRIKDGAVGFYLRRAIRILPPYYLAFIFSMVLWWFTMYAPRPFTAAAYGIMPNFVVMIQDITNRVSFNGPLWSIAVEWRLYLLLPLLLLGWRRISPWLIVLGTVLFGFICTFSFWGGFWRIVEWDFLFLFAAGVAAAWVVNGENSTWMRERLPWNLSMIVCLLALFLILDSASITHWVQYWTPVYAWLPAARYFLLDLLIAGGFAPMLILISTREHFIGKMLSWQPLTAIGLMSYSLYLTHAPLLKCLCFKIMPGWHLTPANTAIVAFALGAPLALLFATGFYFLIELPSIKLLAWMKTRAQRIPVAPTVPAAPA